MIQIPKGCKDVLPSQVYLWHCIEETARKTAAACLNLLDMAYSLFSAPRGTYY